MGETITPLDINARWKRVKGLTNHRGLYSGEKISLIIGKKAGAIYFNIACVAKYFRGMPEAVVLHECTDKKGLGFMQVPAGTQDSISLRRYSKARKMSAETSRTKSLKSFLQQFGLEKEGIYRYKPFYIEEETLIVIDTSQPLTVSYKTEE